MKFEPKNRRDLVDAALGRTPCDFVIRNVGLVNVFTGEIYGADAGVKDGFIACVSADPDGEGVAFRMEGAEEYDGRGECLIPSSGESARVRVLVYDTPENALVAVGTLV